MPKKFIQFLFLVTTIILLASFKAYGPIVLLDEPIAIKPTDYYIAGVTDGRADKVAIAQLVNPDKSVAQTDLQGGAAEAIGKYIEHNLPKDQTLTPVVITIKELKLTEIIAADGSVDGHIKLSFSFALQKDHDAQHLIDYNGGLHYIRTINNIAAIEPRLRTILKSGLTYFNDWMKTNAGFDRKLAKTVKLNFTDYSDKMEGDTIYYATNRPLTWADFQSQVRPPGKFDAEVMPSFGYTQETEVTQGVINVNIALKTSLPKSSCWANYSGRDKYALNHEQRHFDIAKIITEQFKQKILAAKLAPDDYESFINVQYFDSYRDMTAMQQAYDKETNHGSNRFAQTEWNNRIDKELKKFSGVE